MLGGSDSEEAQVIGGIQISYSGPGFGSQLLYLTGILHCGGIVQSSANRNTWRRNRYIATSVSRGLST